EIDIENHSDFFINRFLYRLSVKSQASWTAEPFLHQRQQAGRRGCQFTPAQSNDADLTGYTWTDELARYELGIMRRRASALRHDSQPNPIADETVERRKLVHGYGMAECKPCCRCGSIDDPAGTGVRRQRHQGGILQSLQLDLLGAREPVSRRQHDIESLCAQALGCERLRHVFGISQSKIRQAAANVILNVALNTLQQTDFNSWKVPIVFRD